MVFQSEQFDQEIADIVYRQLIWGSQNLPESSNRFFYPCNRKQPAICQREQSHGNSGRLVQGAPVSPPPRAGILSSRQWGPGIFRCWI